MHSPIFSYLENIPDSLFNIAPEKKDEILDIIKQNKIKFIADDRTSFIFNANTRNKEIHFSVRALEYVWASAYTYWVTYQETCKANHKGIRKIDIHSIPKLKKATDLLQWAQANVSSVNYIPWPCGLPKPAKPPVFGSDEHVATEYFLCAIAWILHHELSHITKKHTNMSIQGIAIQEEKQADENATKWIISGASDAEILQKRVIGIAIANLVLVSFGIEKRDFSSTTHPRSYRRIFDNLVFANLDPNHVVYFFAITNMKLHMDHANITVKMIPHDNAMQCFQDYCITLSKI